MHKNLQALILLFTSIAFFGWIFNTIEPANGQEQSDCIYLAQAKKYCKLQDYDQALSILEKKLKEATKENSGASSDLLMDIAGCYFNQGKFDLAEKSIEKAMKYQYKEGDRYCPVEKLFCKAESAYFLRQYDRALTIYNEALSLLDKFEEPRLRRKLSMSVASCYCALDKYKEAIPYQEAAVRLDKMIFGDRDINYGWGLLKLSDIYRELKDKRSKILFAKAIWIFRISNRTRLLEEAGITNNTRDEKSKELEKRIDSYLFGKKIDKDYALADAFLFTDESKNKKSTTLSKTPCSLWVNQYEATEAPGIVWVDPSKELSAIVIAVPGLGLHHGAYESFAKRIAPYGIATIAFDVKGFGTYLESKGSERLDMKGCVDDLKRIVDTIRSDYPDTPMFLLGESMGGAIVLRLGALEKSNITGIICSVPSGSRYEPAATKVKIGFKYLKKRNDLLDISPYVIGHATRDKKLRKKWKQDPSSRLKLSPKELLEFRNFMKENVDYAKKIDKLPVLIFQGDQDRLVKSKGTYDLFEAVSSKDKTLVVVGDTEHLIFESGQFKNGISLGVIGWMTAHSGKLAREKQAADRSIKH